MRVVVTGASGHIGPNLVRALSERGDRVRVLVRETSDTRGFDAYQPERTVGDLGSVEAVRRAVEGADVVFHLAGLIGVGRVAEADLWRVNVDGVGTIARAALDAGVGRFVHMSSVHAFAQRGPDVPIDERSPRPEPTAPPYDRSKAAGEAALREVVADGLDAVVVQPTAIVGPEDWGPSRIGRAMMLAARGLVPLAPPGGYDFVDVRDVVRGVLLAADRGRTGESYLLPGGYSTVRDMLAMVGGPWPVGRLPRWAAGALVPGLAVAAAVTGGAPFVTSEGLHTLTLGSRCVSGKKAAAELGWTPQIRLRDSVRDTVAWFRATGRLRDRR